MTSSRSESFGDVIAIDPQRRYRSYKEYLKDIPNLTPQSVRKNLGTLLDVIGDRVYLIHQSVKNFFQRKDPLRNSFNGGLPRLVLANGCMTYLRLKEFGHLESIQINVGFPSFIYRYIVPYASKNKKELTTARL